MITVKISVKTTSHNCLSQSTRVPAALKWGRAICGSLEMRDGESCNNGFYARTVLQHNREFDTHCAVFPHFLANSSFFILVSIKDLCCLDVVKYRQAIVTD